MSIDNLINRELGKGTLIKHEPLIPLPQITRTIYLSPSVHRYVNGTDLRAGQLHQDLDAFIGGDIITVSMIPREAGAAYLGILDPTSNGIWDIRSRDPRPGIRVVGGFARKDMFVATVVRVRKDIKNEDAWNLIIAECKDEWKKRFNSIPPVTGGNPSDFISNYTCVG